MATMDDVEVRICKCVLGDELELVYWQFSEWHLPGFLRGGSTLTE